jgi:hypothetical protein
MPEDPAEFMKDYISLHYFYEKKKPVEQSNEEDDANKRKGLRVGDLQELR